MAVDDLPLAVFTTVEVGHTQADGIRRAAVNGGPRPLVADGVSQVTADIGRDDLQVELTLGEM